MLLPGRRRPGRPGPGERQASERWSALGDERPRALLLTHIHLDHAGASRHARPRAGRTSRSTCTSGARRTWSTRRAAQQRRADCTAARWSGSGRGSSRSPRPDPGAGRRGDGHRRRLHGRLHAGPRLAPRLPTATAETASPSSATSPASDPARRRTSIVPPTPPPDIDVEAWLESVDLIAGARPERARADALRPHRGPAGAVGRRPRGTARAGRDRARQDPEAFVASSGRRDSGSTRRPAGALGSRPRDPDDGYAGVDRLATKVARP